MKSIFNWLLQAPQDIFFQSSAYRAHEEAKELGKEIQIERGRRAILIKMLLETCKSEKECKTMIKVICERLRISDIKDYFRIKGFE